MPIDRKEARENVGQIITWLIGILPIVVAYLRANPTTKPDKTAIIEIIRHAKQKSPVAANSSKIEFETPQLYSYFVSGIDASGTKIVGVIKAESLEQARQKGSERGLTITGVKFGY